MRNNNNIRKRKLPNEHKERLPFGIHEGQLISGRNLLSRIPAAQKYFERLSQVNPELALLMLSKVPAEYNRTKHERVDVHDIERMERYHELASRDIRKLMAKGLMAEKMITELNLTKINPNFIDAIVQKKAIRLSEIKEISKKLDKLGKLDPELAEKTRQNIPHILSRTGVLPRGKNPREFISDMIDERIKYAKNPKKYY